MANELFPPSVHSALPAKSCIAALASTALASGPDADLQWSLRWPSIKVLSLPMSLNYKFAAMVSFPWPTPWPHR
ncbi:hypothetical protein SPBR_09150 [Sporothrix brasiliensis 5110]|uniref:Uncharacterized protein n=1 Tax=Sporothrix brasiliensis 5110 TaxID=1398154 RepID=A0A0C2F2P0_9PEZI|nr:uncharacterized protein SPBR_09150 [Sporothrix brasiliensis 5110]KIH93129.1 hypothetical protein SPBR_09150 [Sporothrix brasiliensis 5110]